MTKDKIVKTVKKTLRRYQLSILAVILERRIDNLYSKKDEVIKYYEAQLHLHRGQVESGEIQATLNKASSRFDDEAFRLQDRLDDIKAEYVTLIIPSDGLNDD